MLKNGIDVLYRYNNGDFVCSLSVDGTLFRSWEVENPRPEFPCSIDLKITDFCDVGCVWCHEKSSPAGKHANLHDIKTILSGMHAGTEVAVGGGNPLRHPELIVLLQWMREFGLVANITVNAKNLWQDKSVIDFLRKEKLIHGLGISYAQELSKEIQQVIDANTVVHAISGVHNIWDLIHANFPKLLILGYKKYGRGALLYNDIIKSEIGSWRYWLPTLLRSRQGLITSFDNLALEQLNVKRLLPENVWKTSYMGDDGTFTFYVDAVRMEFAKTSTSARSLTAGKNIKEMFFEIGGHSGLGVLRD